MMKIKYCFLVWVVFALISCNDVPGTTVSIYVEGIPINGKVTIVAKDSVYSVALDSTGSAVFVLAENLKPEYASVNYGRLKIPVFLEPGKSFDLSLKFEGRRVTPLFTGEGARKNEYLNKDAFRRFQPDFKADENTFIAGLKEQEEKFNAALDSMGLDAQFTQLEKKRIHYIVYSLLPLYPAYHSYYAQKWDYKASENFYEVLAGAIPEDETLMDIPGYKEALGDRMKLCAGKDMVEHDPLMSVKKRLDYIQNNIKSPIISEYFVDRFATEYISYSGVEHLEEIMPVYNAKVTSADKKAKFEELCARWARIAKGQPSPAFKYLDIDGKEVNLSDLAGKYVYIDVWATWCGPCRKELPHLKELEHQFKEKNIHFVSISCDHDKAAWEKMVKAEKLGGIQLHTGEDKVFMDTYMIRGIPRFILLDREGKIISADMTRPSHPQTIETLKALEGI